MNDKKNDLIKSYIKIKCFKYIVGAVLVIIPFILLISFFSTLTVSIKHNEENNSQTNISAEDIIERMINVALAEEGTVGGAKYSAWYHGSPNDLSWCSMFVSWVANEVGLIEQDIIPKEQLCYNGIQWFKKKNQFQYTNHYGGNDYVPKRGDIIYYTWNHVKDPLSGHVGIVMYVEGDKVITIEGNTNNNECAVRTRNRLSKSVLGYGTPDYAKASGSTSGNITIEGKDTAEKVWNFFKAKGFSDEATAGILGNLQQESRVNTSLIESNGEGHGLCQWSFGRKKRLFERAAAAGKPWQDFEVQITLLWDELNGLDSTTKHIMNKNYGGLENFKKTNDIPWAVEAFEKSFERAGKPMMSKRIAYAKEFYKRFTGAENE